MRARILCAVAFCLLPVAASAQDEPSSASPPERPRTSMQARSRVNLFRARPDTYVPRPGSRNIYLFPFALSGGYWYPGGPYIPEPSLYGYVPCAGVVRGCPVSPSYYDGAYRDRHHAEFRHGTWPNPAPAAPPAAPPVAPLPISPPGPAKTFYVIAGCYAGDKPPQPEWLPPDCDLSRVRVIPP